MTYARSAGGSPVSVLSVALSRAVQKVHPENTLPIKIMYPVDIRKVMGNRISLVHQAVFAQYKFEPSDVAGRLSPELHTILRIQSNHAQRADVERFIRASGAFVNSGREWDKRKKPCDPKPLFRQNRPRDSSYQDAGCHR